MKPERLTIMDEVVTMPAVGEVLQTREAFFGPASLETDPIFCGDERPSDHEAYLHLFGGASLNVGYNLAVMREADQPGSVDGTFEQEVAAITPVLTDVARVKPGVHSDDHTEGKDAHEVDVHDTDKTGIGCKYADKRQDISQLIADNGEGLITEAMKQLPELFDNGADLEYARKIVAAHVRLANRSSFFTSGRKVAAKAIEKGAESMVVRGEHSGKKGIINRRNNTSLKTTAAAEAGLATYDSDEWAGQEIHDRIHHLYPHDKKQVAIARLIDTLGSFLAVGVDEVETRY